MKFRSKKPHYEYLRKKWTLRHRNLEESLWEKHGKSFKQLAFGGLSGLMLLTASPQPIPLQSGLPKNLIVNRDDILKDYDRNVLLAEQLRNMIPKEVRPLNPQEELEVIDVLTRNFQFTIKAEQNGIRLNRNYGLIGEEQHLYRYPGDNLFAHADTASDWAKYGTAGIAPNLGAWGYFASSKKEFTNLDKLREKYYLAIQTFLVPGYAENVSKFRDFFKFRKMLIVNTQTGQAVVVVIADAGPSEWTGKHLGGSPEVMDSLGLAGGLKKGAVLYFFIDDPEDKIPLGPIKVGTEV